MERELCGCHGVVHPLIPVADGALVCENCGNIYCEKQQLGDCLFCGAPMVDGRVPFVDSVGSASRFAPPTSPSARSKRPQTGREAVSAPGDTDAEAALQFRNRILRNVDEYGEVDPDQAVIDDQEFVY